MAAEAQRMAGSGRAVPEPADKMATMDAALRRSLGPGWLLDEVASAGRENLDPDHAAHYDQKEDAGAAEEVRLLQELGLGGHSVVVDLGAGTGQFTVAAAQVCARVVAVDVSPVMLAKLAAKVSRSELDNVEIVRAGFLTYEHGGSPADIVYSRWALHHLPDFWKSVALQRIRCALRPGGLLRLSDIVYTFDPWEAEARIAAWCATLPSEPDGEGDWSRADIEEHVRDEHSTYSWLLEPMIERCGFEIERWSTRPIPMTPGTCFAPADPEQPKFLGVRRQVSANDRSRAAISASEGSLVATSMTRS